MRYNLEDYYKLFNDRDAERVAAFDRIVESPHMNEEFKAKLMEWYSVAEASIKGLGDKGAKALVMSVVEIALMGEDELKQTMAIGRLVNQAAPEEWRVK